MNSNELKTLCERACRIIFDGEKQGVRIRKYSGGTVKGVQLNGLNFVQQNPNADSEYAKQARMGMRIVWVFRNGKYLARFVWDHQTLAIFGGLN